MIQYSKALAIEPRRRGVLDTPLEPVIGLAEGETRWRGMTVKFGAARDEDIVSQLRLVARLDLGLGFRLAEHCLVVHHLADARKRRAFDPRIR